MCKETIYLHLFPLGLSPLGDHQFNYPSAIVSSVFIFFSCREEQGTIKHCYLLKGLPGNKEKEK